MRLPQLSSIINFIFKRIPRLISVSIRELQEQCSNNWKHFLKKVWKSLEKAFEANFGGWITTLEQKVLSPNQSVSMSHELN